MERLIKNQKGFSLIELMVVVAIIGLLAALAIPNYQRFQRRAMQTEATTVMSNIYTAQKAFIGQWGLGSANLRQIGVGIEGNIVYRAGFTADASANNPNGVTRLSGYRGPLPANANQEDQLDTFLLCNGVGTGNAEALSACGLALGISASTVTVAQLLGSSGTCVAGSNSGDNCATGASNWVGYPTCTGTGSQGCTSSASLTVGNAQRGDIQFTIGAAADIGGEDHDQWTMNESKTITNTKDGTE